VRSIIECVNAAKMSARAGSVPPPWHFVAAGLQWPFRNIRRNERLVRIAPPRLIE